MTTHYNGLQNRIASLNAKITELSTYQSEVTSLISSKQNEWTNLDLEYEEQVTIYNEDIKNLQLKMSQEASFLKFNFDILFWMFAYTF